MTAWPRGGSRLPRKFEKVSFFFLILTNFLVGGAKPNRLANFVSAQGVLTDQAEVETPLLKRLRLNALARDGGSVTGPTLEAEVGQLQIKEPRGGVIGANAKGEAPAGEAEGADMEGWGGVEWLEIPKWEGGVEAEEEEWGELKEKWGWRRARGKRKRSGVE